METGRAVGSGMLYVSEDGRLSEEQAKSITPRKTTRKNLNTGYGAKRSLFIAVVFALAGMCSFAATDVLFLVDTTGSMGGLGNFKTALSGIIEAIDANSLCPETIMYGVADYRNYTDGGNYTAYGVNLDQPFTSSTQDALSVINGLLTGDGGDGPESQLKAMVTIAEHWATGSGDLCFGGRINAQKILIWAGDAPGHIAGDESGSSGPPPAGYYPTLDATIDALTAQGIIVFALNSAGCDSGLNALYGDHRQAGEITAATGGELFCSVGSGGPDIEADIIDVLTCFSFTKEDGIDPNDCVVPQQDMVYTVCWSNESSRTVYDGFIRDELPEGVDYPVTYTFDSNSFTMVSSDPNYDPETHSYIWPLGTIWPSGSGCVQLTVVVNDKAVPGGILHNVAELYGMVYDPNSLNLVERRLARVIRDTKVCCWDTSGILYVDKNATGANTGLNWQDAYTDLQDAITRARETTCAEAFTIYVAQGTYRPEDTEDGFVLPEGVSVYGGFPTGGCDFSERNPKRYETILTGLIDEDEFPDADTIVTMGDETLLDGFTVMIALESAIKGEGVDFSIEHCIIKENFQFGVNAVNCNTQIRWTTVSSNGKTGLYHQGEGCHLTVDNSWCLRNGEHGIFCLHSTPFVRNSIISESALVEQGRAGIHIEYPEHQPKLLNLTIANNKAAGLFFVDDSDADGDPNNLDYPDLQNSILYFNNNNNSQITGFNPDTVANFCCIQDCNTLGTTNINDDPKFAYTVDPNGTPDPNNYHLSVESLCIDSGNPFLSYAGQVDIDGEGLDRKYGDLVDIGADEVYDCDDDYLSEIDVHNDLDWDADGIVNMNEFRSFSRAWLSRSPDEFTDPNLVDPNAIANWNPICNLVESGNSQYVIDLADLCEFLEDWLWVACWKLDELNAAAATAQTESLMAQSFSALRSLSANSLETTVAVQPEISVETLVQIIGFLNEAEVEMPDNIEAIEAVRAILVEQLSAMLSTEERQPLDISGEI